MATVKFPDKSNRTTVIGQTGSGKTVFGVWLLSTCCTLDWKRYPVIIIDFKRDELIEAIEPQEIDVRKRPPKKAGLYVVRPLPHETEELEQFLWKVWDQENTGLFVDEGYMLGKSKAFAAILTTGRSKKIPVIQLTQRPVFLSRFAFTESQYFAIFRLIDKRDIDTVQSFVNADIKQSRLPYHCLWYDVGGNAGGGAAFDFKPVPPVPEIVALFAREKPGLQKRVM
jgi:hypothetical protein